MAGGSETKSRADLSFFPMIIVRSRVDYTANEICEWTLTASILPSWLGAPPLIATTPMQLKVNRAHVGINGLLDPSQHGDGHHFRNFRLGSGRPFKFGLVSGSRCVRFIVL